MISNPFSSLVSNRRKRVVIAEADLLFAEGLAALLVRDARWEVFAIVRSVEAVLALAQGGEFGIVLIDANMLMSGGETFRSRLLEHPSAPLVVALASGGRVLARVRAFQSDRLIAISHDAPIGTWLSALSTKLGDQGGTASTNGTERAAYDVLTPAQKEVFLRMVKGETVGAIAKSVGRSPKTISSHKSAAQRVLGVNSLGGLIRYAVRNKLISVHDAESAIATQEDAAIDVDETELITA